MLEILHRLPVNPPEVFEPYAADIVDLLMGLVKIENEDNAVLCMKTIMDLERHTSLIKVLRDKVQPFLDMIQEMFQTMEQVVRDTFDNPTPGASQGVPSTPNNAQNFQSPRPASPVTSVAELGAEQQTTRPLLKGMQSFKVLAECPIIVVSLFQVHRSHVNDNVKRFVPLIKGVLLLQAKPQERAHMEARSRGGGAIFTGVSKEIKNRAAFGEFITAQVKTMSFLAYLLRVYANQLTDFLPTLPDIVVRLLKDCPRERSAARKELLVAIRHIINFNFRKIFTKKIDDLLDERILIGDGLTVYETMRPLAYSMLADLIHHVRNSLDKKQIRRTIEVYTQNLHDNFPGTSFQTMSAKLLLNMADCIAELPDKQEARYFLIMILDAIGDKFAAMNRQYHNAVKLTKQYSQQALEANPEDYLPDNEAPDWDEVDIFYATPIKISNPRDRGADPVADNQFLFRNLIDGLKKMFYQLKACNPPGQLIDPANAPANWQEVSYGYSAEEVLVITKLFREGAHVFRYYTLEKPPAESMYTSPVEFMANHYMTSSGRDEKDLLETFSTVFHSLDPATFYEVFHPEIPRLYEMMFEHTALLHVPQFFLAAEATSPSFAGMLLQFLMDRIEEVGTSDVKKSSILLRLFKLSFMAVTLFSTQNEQVLQPHVTKIITKSLQLSTTAQEPMNYFLLLRSLFRSIGGGRFEHLYHEILPLLEMLLEVLNNLLMAARKPPERDLYVELCLTVPARLSNLLPHLSYLMRPLTVALRAGSDLVGQGLRTLELCVDNLTADYLDPIMAPVIDDLMSALWEHLRPAPYTHFHAHTTMRILGKLGGRNRKFLSGPPPLAFKQFSDDECSIDIKLIGSNKDRAFPAVIGIDLAVAKLMEVPKSSVAKKSDGFYKQQALKLISSQLKLHIGFDNLPDDFAQLVRLQASDLLENKYDAASDVMEKSEREKSNAKKDVQEDLLKKLLKTCIFAVSIPELKEEATSLVRDVSRHFTILEIGKALASIKHNRKPFDVKTGEGPLYLDCKVFADAVVESLSAENPAVREAAEQAIMAMHHAASVIFGSEAKAEKLTFFLHLSKVFCHSCYEEEWYTKSGGSLGIKILTTTIGLGDPWVSDRQIEFVRALMYVIKDMPQDLPASTRVQAQGTLEALLRRCNRGVSKDDINSPQSRLFNLCGFLIYELAHMNKHVREAAQKAFAIIAEVIGAEIHELVAPVKDRLLQPIFMKPLRALPFTVQIGYIEAISFCLSLQHDIVTFDQEQNTPLNRLLTEVLALADAEDDSLAAKPNEQRTSEAIISLRISCIKLLSIAMEFPEFGSPTNSRSRIIAVFFKSLYSKSTEVIDAANIGLKGVLTVTNKLPKDLLQNGLRPILMNLQDPQRLSVAGLEGLARLLTLLTNYFKVEIGMRLLDHMKTIADATTLQKVSFTLVDQNGKMRVVAAILNIFHLLPAAAVSFMDKMIDNVLDLEEKLRRTHYSPFREPLIKYLNRYPKETWGFFSMRMNDMKYGRLLAQVLAEEACGPLREAIIADLDGLQKTSLENSNNSAISVASISGIHIIHSLCMHHASSDWLVSQETLRKRLLAVGKGLNVQLRNDVMLAPLRVAVEQAQEQLMEIFTSYLTRAPQNLDFLFELIDAITSGDIKFRPSLSKYFYDNIISNTSVDYWRSVVTKSIDLYAGRTSSQNTKTFAFHYLVNPIFAMDIMRKRNRSPGIVKSPTLMDKSMTDLIHNKLWKPQLGDLGDETGQSRVDHARMELLQLSALLLKYHSAILTDARKDVIKFGWNYIRLDDVINKHAAYVLIGYFVVHYETPSKIVIQIYVALLRAHQNEGRALVTQALELLAPSLPKRVASSGDSRIPIWAKWPRKILSEESTNLQQLISIFQFLVKHPDLFYESREQFAPLIIQSLSKIAQPVPQQTTQPSSNETKKLALNLITLIWQWEERRVKGTGAAVPRATSESPQTKKRKAEAPADLGLDRPEFQVPAPLRMVLIKYLVQVVCALTERYPVPSAKTKEQVPSHAQQPTSSEDMCSKAIRLLHVLLLPEYWGDLDVELYPKVTELVLASEKTDKPDDKFVTNIVNTLQVVRVIVNMRSTEWLVAHLPQLQKLLEKPLRSENPEIQDCLHTAGEKSTDGDKLKPLVQRILDAVPEDKPGEEEPDQEAPTSEFVTFLSAIATETLAAGNHISSLNILWTLSRRKPKELDAHIPQVMKALQLKLAKDHLAAYGGVNVQGGAGAGGLRPGEAGAPSTPDQHEMQIQTDLILKTIEFISMRMSILGELRRQFLSVLASLVERSQNEALCLKILEMAEGWVFNSSEPWPTLKEKNAVLQKMLLFENRPNSELLTKFLDLIIRIYEDPKITRTELTVRLEHAFLIGTRAQNVDLRKRFMAIFDRSLTRTANARLSYILASQQWDTLAESFWLAQASQLIFGAVEMAMPAQLHHEDFTTFRASDLFDASTKDQRKDSMMIDDKAEEFFLSHRRFCAEIGDVKVRDLLEPLVQLQHTDHNVAYQVWVALFPLCWSALSKDDRMELEKGMVTLLTRNYHERQVDKRPNVVQALLDGAVRSNPRFKLPPHVMKYLSRTYDAWYISACALEERTITPLIDTPAVRESNLDALVEIYAGLQEDDFFYGAWRRRCQFVETNAALSYEQNGMWDKAQQLYEAAQIKARTGAIPFSQGEYMLWEDHWVTCAQKLQQWEILSDFAKHENFNDLLLESAWRNLDTWTGNENREQLDSIIKAVSDAPTPRRTFFQAFMSLLKFHGNSETQQEFSRVCDESIQLSIRKWHQLPKRITNAHIPILQSFQQLVELHDASLICGSLANTNQQNLDTKSTELKLLLGTWRDRLPNVWDDINAWQDLVTWRQHIFQLINGTYLNLLPPQQGNATGNSYAYRGYHETAWIINRFAHVARKHQLPEVCISQLSRIYTLPNIEIQEAFLKLREQAKCHYQNRSELTSGLDVINNTNLNYFGPQQKAEFFTLKGMFLAKLNHKDDADTAFGTALFYDIRLPKAWAEWGYYNDNLFKEDPTKLDKATEAVCCYLEAAGLFKNAKSRKLLSRILWLLSLDDADCTISKGFEEFKGETPTWYWITFIPQLLTSLDKKEARLSRAVLVKIAKIYPQALYYLLRTTREDMLAIKKQQEQKQEKLNRAKQSSMSTAKGSPEIKRDTPSRPGTANGEVGNQEGKSSSPKPEVNGQSQSSPNGGPPAEPTTAWPPVEKKPWDYTEEILSVLKTAFPLLALSMETMVDQIQKHFKCPPDEDAYRLIVALLNDGLSVRSNPFVVNFLASVSISVANRLQYVGRMPTSYAQDVKLPPATEANITRFAETVLPAHIRKSFEADFVTKKPTMYEYIQKLRRWRDRFEEKLDHRPSRQLLEQFSPHLSEFRFLKFDEVEVPGQYLQHRDKNQDFIRIDRFLPYVNAVRTIGVCHRRLKIRGHDGSIHPFAVQHPAARHCRREERILQLFRIFNGVLVKRKESRRRNLTFHLPIMVPVTPHIRLVQDDASYVSLQGIFEDHCRRHGMNKDEPVLFTIEKLRALTDMKGAVSVTELKPSDIMTNIFNEQKYADQSSNFRMEAFTAIQERWVPSHVVLEYFQATYPSFSDFWLFRRQFSYQFASLTFMTYIMHMNNRYPHKLSIARATGNIWGSELIPAMAAGKAFFHNPEPVPFRLTPNLQTLMGPIAMEGIFSCAIMAIARCLTEPEFELEQQLSIFIRDEMFFWFTQQHRGGLQDNQLRETVQVNSDIVVKKAVSLAQPPVGNLPANQTVIDLISKAVNPQNLAQSDALWMPYL